MSLTKIALRRLDKEVMKAVGPKKISLIRTSLFGTPAAKATAVRNNKIGRLTNAMSESGNIPKQQAENYDKFIDKKYNEAKHALRKGSRTVKGKDPIEYRLEDYKDEKERAQRRGLPFPSKVKDSDTWGENVKNSGVGKEDKVVVTHGGGKHYLEHMLKTKNKSMGYKLEYGDEKGIQVHPMTKSYKNYAGKNSDRINYYSSNAGLYGDVPVKMTARIKSKHLTRANNDYEAGIKAGNLKHLEHVRLKETGEAPAKVFISEKGGKVDKHILQKMKDNTLDGSKIKSEVSKINAKIKRKERSKNSKKPLSNYQKGMKKVIMGLRGKGDYDSMSNKHKYIIDKNSLSRGNRNSTTTNEDLRKLLDDSSKKPASIHSKIGEGSNSTIKERLAEFKKSKPKKEKPVEHIDDKKHNNTSKKPTESIEVKENKNDNTPVEVKNNLKSDKPTSASKDNTGIAKKLMIGGGATILTGGGLHYALKNKEESSKRKKGLASA